MLYLHDVWVNWFEGADKGYKVHEFHEWRKSDGIESISQLPLVYVEEDFYNYIEDGMAEIPQELLHHVYRRAYIKESQQRKSVSYAFAITDGKGVLAVDTLESNLPMRKSRLIPRQELLSFDMIEVFEPTKFEYEEDVQYHPLLAPDPKFMNGLIRKERELKQILFMALDELKCYGTLNKLQYLHVEWDVNNKGNVEELDFNESFNLLFDNVKYGWSDNHEELLRVLVKNTPFLNRLYEIELESAKEHEQKLA